MRRITGSRCHAVLLLGLWLPQAACGAGWHRIDQVRPSNLPQRQQVQVWRGREKLQLHSIRFSGDSISGVPYVQPPDCDSCRISLLSASVDSLRAGNPTGGFWKTTGLVFGGLLVMTAIACGTSDSVCNSD